MSVYVLLLVVLVKIIQTTTTIETSIKIPECNSSTLDENNETEIEEKMKLLRIEVVKYQILSNVNLKEAPPTVQKNSEVQNEIIALLMKEEEEWQQKRDRLFNSEERLVVHAKRCNYECKLYDISFCQRFEFRIPSDVELSSSEFWVYKQKPWPFNNVTVTVLCSCDGRSILKQQNDFPNENITQQWVSFNLSALSDIECKKENFTCEIETKGITMDLHNQPFLKIMKIKEVRNRREIDNHTIRNHGCKSVPFNVSFKVLGFNNWVIYPEVYQANTCEGYCLHAQNHHENLISTIIRERERNETECDHCWFTCCRPKEYKSLEILYWETETTVSQRNLTDMIVVSCSCS